MKIYQYSNIVSTSTNKKPPDIRGFQIIRQTKNRTKFGCICNASFVEKELICRVPNYPPFFFFFFAIAEKHLAPYKILSKDLSLYRK